MSNSYIMTNMKVLMAHLVTDAIRIYAKGKNPSNVGLSDWPVAWLDALTFLHGERAIMAIEDAIGDDHHKFLADRGVPLPAVDCPCFECRISYVKEAQFAASLVSSRRKRFRFKIGSKHNVYFKCGKLTAIFPVGDDDGTWLTPDEYILTMTGIPSPYQEKRKHNGKHQSINSKQVQTTQGRQTPAQGPYRPDGTGRFRENTHGA